MNNNWPKRLVLVRHGESWLNRAKAKTPIYFESEADRALVAGVPDHLVDLTELGIEQAKLTGQGLFRAGERFDRVYDSGYVRTVRTIDLVLEAYPNAMVRQMPRQSHPLVRERESGYTYNMLRSEVVATFPWLENYWRTSGPVFARPPGGESMLDVMNRVALFVRELREVATGQTVLVGSHGRVNTVMRALLEGWSYGELETFLRGPGPKNCAITIYEPSSSGEYLELAVYNQCYWQ